MIKRVRLKHNFKIDFIYLVLIIILFNTILIVKNFSRNVNNSINNMASKKTKEITALIISSLLTENKIYTEDFKDIISIKYNEKNEITAVNYDLEKVYVKASELNKLLYSEFSNIENAKINNKLINESFFKQDSDNGLILLLPSGYAFNNSLLANLGPSIPIKILFINSVFLNIKTKVTSYGINNALMEVYLTIDVKSSILFPNHTEDINTGKEFLISAKVIEGKVPYIYGNGMNSESGKINVPLENSL